MINSIKKIFTDPVAYTGGLFLFYFSATIYIFPYNVMASFFDPFLEFYDSCFWAVKHKDLFVIIFNSLFFVITFIGGTVIFWGLRNYKKWSWLVAYFLSPIIIFIYSIFGLDFLYLLFSRSCEHRMSTDHNGNCNQVMKHPSFAIIFIAVSISLLFLLYKLVKNKDKYKIKSNWIESIFYILMVLYILLVGWFLWVTLTFVPIMVG